MNSDLWIGAATTLAGVGLGGVISLLVNRQQMRDAREQRVAADMQERIRRSQDRRFDAYTEFIGCARSYRNAIGTRIRMGDAELYAAKDLNALAAAMDASSARVFLVLESEQTYRACAAIMNSMRKLQNEIHERDADSGSGHWKSLDEELAQRLREFQVAARIELEIKGVDFHLVRAR